MRRLITKFVDAVEDRQTQQTFNGCRKFNTDAVEETDKSLQQQASTMNEDILKTETSAFLEGSWPFPNLTFWDRLISK